MSYLDYFRNNIVSRSSENHDYIKGTCNTMCPQAEVELRVREKMVHVLEVVGSEKKLVKAYTRSAADSNMSVPHLLRPYSVLKNTLQYLLFDLLSRTDVSPLVAYNFVDDRLRAIRQDMTIQRLSPSQCSYLLEPMIRFYVYYGYKLSGLPLSDHDPFLNKKYLLECMKWFLCCCDEIAQPHHQTVQELSGLLSHISINKEPFNTDQVLVESLYILCNLGDAHPLIRYLNLPKNFKSNASLQLAYKISVAYIKGNYIAIFRLMQELCPLSYYAVCMYQPEIQRHALKVMSYAYSSKQFKVPIEVIQSWLHFASKDEVWSVCKHYGLVVQADTVRFSKTDFKNDVSMHSVEKNALNEKVISLQDIFTYTTN